MGGAESSDGGDHCSGGSGPVDSFIDGINDGCNGCIDAAADAINDAAHDAGQAVGEFICDVAPPICEGKN